MGKVNIIGNKNMDELVVTPGGLRPKSNVHLIENGTHVGLKNGVLIKVNNETKSIIKELGKINKIEHHLNRNSLRKFEKHENKIMGQPPITDKWIIYSGWQNETGNPISYFSTKWIVPPEPTSDNGQLIYLFNGIENSSFEMILQPVLQWGNSPAGGGSFWAVSNWFVGSPESGIALHSELINVNPGDILQGIITLTGKSGSRFNYRSSFNGIPMCDLSISEIEELTWANETLECYYLKQFSDYPNTHLTAMSDIEILVDANHAPIIWTAYNEVTDNGQHCSIIKNGSPNGCVNLFYTQLNN